MSSFRAQEDGEVDRSDDEGAYGEGSGNATITGSKRNARACDRCRKSKSKCEPSPTGGDKCRSCVVAGLECTFSGPIFRRGPPKGYIQALEHRLHQMESVLAAIMSSQDVRAVGVITDLRNDNLAASILDRVDSGPFGPNGRKQRSVDPTQDNFFASIVSAAPPKIISSRSRRQSRKTRESVIHEEPVELTRPSLQWQDRLSESLAHLSGHPRGGTSAPGHSVAISSSSGSPTDSGYSEEPTRQKRRVDVPQGNQYDPQWNDLHVMADIDLEVLDDCADAFGNLSIDENREVRYHGNSSGLHLLAQHKHGRNVGGMWNFPMQKLWPGPAGGVSDQDVEAAALPELDVQDHLIDLYFTYINPSFPVIERESFMAQYNAQISEPPEQRSDHSQGPMKPERMQKISELLLFSIFAFAARYSDRETQYEAQRARHGHVPEPGARYAARARLILDTMYQESRTSTCQALILLGVREFGIGSLEEGWLHIGMALRMAFDLGLNRNAEKWQHEGRLLFTPEEQHIRRRIWWACCLADKFSSLFLGRPMAIQEGDFSTLLPDVPSEDAEELWQPCHTNSLGQPVAPMPGHLMSYLRHSATLSVIIGDIVEKIYPVTRVSRIPRRTLMEQIHARLVQWSLDLPEPLQYASASANTRACPPPHVLVLHVQYWAAVLLLHRPFLPPGNALQVVSPGSTDADLIPWKAFDLCRSAACNIAFFATAYHTHFDLRWAPPFILTSLQSAGIMHIITLRHRPSDPQAALCLQDCISALINMVPTWPSAMRVRDLLRGVKLQLDQARVSRGVTDRTHRKRPAEAAFEEGYLPGPPPSAFGPLVEPPHQFPADAPLPPLPHVALPESRDDGAFCPKWVGADLAPGQSSLPVLPGFEWWSLGTEGAPLAAPGPIPAPVPVPGHESYHMLGGAGVPSQEFTFDARQFSPDFMQGIRDPVLHFPSIFTSR
ncbi:fungal-specific transcription factor domain-containing protein [Amylocystis lapponica]|nr:fungal-specific transcription factor domain-containing protein [Amylocystis lapponica]